MTPEELPIVFAEGGALPKPEGFPGYFLPKIAADAIFVQPLFPPAVGHQQIAQAFRRMFALMPGMTASPVSSAVAQRAVFIESVCTATLAGRRVEFQVCDRFEIKDGLITKRHSYSDPLPLLATALRHPSAWPRVLKARR